VRYRRHLTRLASWDLGRSDPLAAVSTVAEALADLAGAALDASLAVARLEVKFAAADIERIVAENELHGLPRIRIPAGSNGIIRAI